jgi:hypothetical protein
MSVRRRPPKNARRDRRPDHEWIDPTGSIEKRSGPVITTIKTSFASFSVFRRPGGLRRSDKTRSHPELGRQTLQRQWYYVSRPGRVGRRQACKRQKTKSLFNKTHRKTQHNKTRSPNAAGFFVFPFLSPGRELVCAVAFSVEKAQHGPWGPSNPSVCPVGREERFADRLRSRPCIRQSYQTGFTRRLGLRKRGPVVLGLALERQDGRGGIRREAPCGEAPKVIEAKTSAHQEKRPPTKKRGRPQGAAPSQGGNAQEGEYGAERRERRDKARR